MERRNFIKSLFGLGAVAAVPAVVMAETPRRLPVADGDEWIWETDGPAPVPTWGFIHDGTIRYRQKDGAVVTVFRVKPDGGLDILPDSPYGLSARPS